jgi:SAM-dependent methyltransferase
MSLSSEYKRQVVWRDWPRIFDALPALRGQTILDLGCGVGDQAAELVRRGARVIGVDLNEDLLREARERQLANAEFRLGDLRAPLHLGSTVDGLWSSFSAAYFPDLHEVLMNWVKPLRPGGWVALTEIDDLFGHAPLGAETMALLGEYARDAFAAKRYDFHMGGKLRGHLEKCGLTVLKTFTVEDQELAFDGPANAEVVEAWRNRFDRMTLLRDFCGSRFEEIRREFLGCLTNPEHRSTAKVRCCIATR